jgi:RNA polymerase sigma factor (TIGR02999 family)
MSEPESGRGAGEITGLLRDATRGDREAFDRLLPLVYDELRQLARSKLRFERAGHTLTTTALVHEAYLKLIDQTRVEWRGRHHFFAVASEAMRRILIDYAKRRLAAKRGGGAGHIRLDEAPEVAAPPADDAFSLDQAHELIALDEALERLAGFNAQGARVVQYRFFGGLTNAEVADVMGTSERTARRAWTVAKAWLRRELERALPGRPPTFLNLQAGGA